ncbi:gamma-tubulin complex component 2 homolog isoform X2 [Chironomus tepperi]|uniref:gamma-tubulin complex component 2 homolog isoform X2 n=1 Tax=Chironomus tepperi TaxID=113505 RepID=UPI00391F4735
MSELKAKKKLDEIAVRWNGKVSPEQILLVFKNSNNKYSTEKLITIAKQYFKNQMLDSDKLLTQFEVNVKRNQKTPYEALIIMLNNASISQSPTLISSSQQQKPTIPLKPSNLQVETKISAKNDFESPALCSTRVDNNNSPDIVVSEIKEKLAQATQQVSRSSSSYLRQSINTSGGSILPTARKSPQTPIVLNPISTWTFSFGGDDVTLPFQMKMPKPIVGLPSSEQEREIIRELLYTLIGVNGSLIVPKLKTYLFDPKDEYTVVNNWLENRSVAVEFDLNEQITDSIRDILKDILPLANYYFQLQYFIESTRGPSSGQVLQALSEAISKLVDDYYATIAQLESMHIRHELNLHKLLFYLRPIIQTMETVTKICGKLQENRYRGGNVLTSLHDSISLFSGDKNSQKILIHLTQKAAEPYMEILSLWVFKGIIQDPKNEFFVEDNQNDFQNLESTQAFNEFWDKRYVLKTDKIPRFLEKQANIIMRTGKYLNVVRDCGKRLSFNHNSDTILKFSHTDDQSYINHVNDAYIYSSKALMELIMDDHDLMGHLLSVKRYFLLQQGDFIVQFMDACEHELMKGVDKVIPIRLENLLELTLRLSSAKHDKYQDNLSTVLMPFDIFTQMTKIIKSKRDEYDDECDVVDYDMKTGIECFSFGYKTGWPISIILNHMTISKYQIIFRQLFYLKHVENFLCRVWIANNNAKKFDQRTSEQYRSAFTLRQRMMSAIQNLEYYMMVEVIEPEWHRFMQQISKAKTFDDVLAYHDDFLDKCLKNCMLTEPDILKCIVKMCTLCIGFCEFIEKEAPTASTETFSEKVTKYDTLFVQQTVALLQKIHELAEKNHSEKYVSLIHRINFNNFYTTKLNSCQ